MNIFPDPLDISQWRKTPDRRILDAIDAYFAAALPWEAMLRELDAFRHRCEGVILSQREAAHER